MNKMKRLLSVYHPIAQILILGTALISLTSAMSIPFLAVYLNKHTQLSYAVIGMIVGAGPLAATVGGFIGGILSDRFGRKVLMFGSLCSLAVVFVLLILVTNPFLLFLLSMIRGLATSFFSAVSKALMGDITPQDKRFKLFSTRYLAVNLGYALGPMIGANLGLEGSSIAFQLTGTVYLLYALILLIGFKKCSIVKPGESNGSEDGITIISAVNIIRRDSILLFFILGGISLTIVHGQMSVYLSQYVSEQFEEGVTLFSYLLSVHGFTIVLLQAPITKMLEKYKGLQTITMGSMLFALGEVGFAFSTNEGLLMLSMIVFTIGEILVIPSEYALIDVITPEKVRGNYYGAQEFTQLGGFIGPWLAGLILSSYGGKAMFIAMSGISLFSLLFYAKGWKMYRIKQSSAKHGPPLDDKVCF